MREILITKETAGGRLDKAIFKYLDKAGSGFVYKMLRKKNILLNDRKATGSERLQEGDRIRLYLAEDTIQRFCSRKEYSHGNSDQKTKDFGSLADWIVYEDENLLAVSKPQGLLSQKASDKDLSLNDLIRSYLGSDALFTPGIANRLDRNTSGLVLTGKNPAAQRSLSLALQNRTLRKYYLCIVEGCVNEDQRLEGILKKNTSANQVRIFDRDSTQEASGQFIRTDLQVLSHTERCSLLKVHLITGRSHQIRAHLASQGHPIIGDRKYGDPSINRAFYDRYSVNWQLLHAYEVCFDQMEGVLESLNGTCLKAPVPEVFLLTATREGLRGIPM